MILNNTKNRVVGVVKDPDIKSEYTGKTTSTAKVTINPETKEISVDVIASGFLGETSETAYPGNEGYLAQSLAVKAIDEIEKEQQRAVRSEQALKQELESVETTIGLGDARVQTKLEQEVLRATLAEKKIETRITDIEHQSLENFTVVFDKFIEANNTIQELNKNLSSDIRQLEDDLYDELVKVTDNFSNEIDNLDKTLSSVVTTVEKDLTQKQQVLEDKITNIESKYTTKTYLHEEIHNALTLSKQLVDSVDLVTNTVTIDGVVIKPIDGVLYMLKDDSSDVEDIYKEYTTIDNILTLIGDTSISLDGYATESWVSNQKYLTQDEATSNYAKIDYVDNTASEVRQFVTDSIDAIPEVDLTPYAKKTDIPDVSSFIAEIPAEYVTEDELKGKGYYTLEKINELLKSIEFIDGGTSTSV